MRRQCLFRWVITGGWDAPARPRGGCRPTQTAMAMLLASEPPAMEAYRVSRDVNTPRNNIPRLLEAVA